MGMFDFLFAQPTSMPGDYGHGEAPNTPGGMFSGLAAAMQDPRNQAGLAAFGRALAQAGAPRRGPLTWGGGLSDAFAGMNEGRQVYDAQAQDKAMKKAQLDALMEKLKQDQFKGKLLNDAFQPSQQPQAPMQQSMIGPPGDVMPPQPTQPQIPQQGGFMANMNPDRLGAMELAGIPGAKNVFDIYKYINDGIKREPGATYKNPMTGQETHYPSLPQGFTRDGKGQVSLAPGFNEANDQFTRTQTLASEGAKANFDFVQVPDGRGGTRMMSKAEATRSLGGGDGNVGYSDPNAGESRKAFGTEFAKTAISNLEQSRSRADSAAQSMPAIAQIEKALSSGNVIAGPLSGGRIKLAQLANMTFGTGEDALVQTRNSIQGMAELALQSRGMLKGQGQVSNFEQEVLDKARSGSMDFTVPELKALVSVSKRAANAAIKSHSDTLNKLPNDPEIQKYKSMFEVARPNDGWSIVPVK